MCRVTPISVLMLPDGGERRRMELQDVREHRLRAALPVAAGDADDERVDARELRRRRRLRSARCTLPLVGREHRVGERSAPAAAARTASADAMSGA